MHRWYASGFRIGKYVWRRRKQVSWRNKMSSLSFSCGKRPLIYKASWGSCENTRKKIWIEENRKPLISWNDSWLDGERRCKWSSSTERCIESNKNVQWIFRAFLINEVLYLLTVFASLNIVLASNMFLTVCFLKFRIFIEETLIYFVSYLIEKALCKEIKPKNLLIDKKLIKL